MAYQKFIVTGMICAVLVPGLTVAQDTFGGAQQQTQPPGTFPQQPGGFPQQPGNYPQQPGGFPQQPGNYPQQPESFPQQPGGFPQQPGGVQQPSGANPGQLTQMEQANFGVQPISQLYSGQMHAPTPTSIPGGQVVTTQALMALVQGNQTPYFLFDVLGGPEKLPNAVPAAWVAQPGSFNDQTQQQFTQMLQQGTQGRKDVSLIFYCLSNQCWMSYNAALRAINAGYTKVMWYRGGIEAWKMAGLPTQSSQQGFPPQQR